MSGQYEIDPQAALLADQVLEAGQRVRAGQEAIEQKMIEEALALQAQEGTAEAQLAGETERLLNRMAWLYEKPKVLRLLSRSAIDVVCEDEERSRSRGIIKTKPLTDGEIARLEGEHLLFSGIICWRYYEKNPRDPLMIVNGRKVSVERVPSRNTLHIDQEVRDETTGVSGSRELYRIHPYDSKTGLRIKIRGGVFDGWRSANGFVPAQYLYGHAMPYVDPEMTGSYPDHFFLKPLALVKEMNKLLGTKNKQTVVQ